MSRIVSDPVGPAAFSVLVTVLVVWMARRDLVFAGFLFFFFLYTIFARGVGSVVSRYIHSLGITLPAYIGASRPGPMTT